MAKYIEDEGLALAVWEGYLNPSMYMVALWATNGWPSVFITDDANAAARQLAGWGELGSTSIRKGGTLLAGVRDGAITNLKPFPNP